MTADGPVHDSPLSLLLARLPLDRRTRIVDVGANPNVGAPPYADLLQAGACDVVGFEPQPQAFADLGQRKSERETYFPFAVGDGSRRELKVYRAHGYASIFAPHEPGFRVIGGGAWARIDARIDFDTVALDSQPLIGPVDLLKIDIQGGEVEVFRGAQTTLRQAMAVIVELRYFPLYDGEPMMGGVDAELRRQGFVLHRFLETKAKPLLNSQMARLNTRKLRDQLVDGDAVYLRDLGRIDACSDAQLCHLCITAAAVFHSHTVVLHAIDELARRGVVPDGLAADYVTCLPASLRRDGGAPA